ncbi:MAG: TetR/AcrR family transcriptional repressor of mexCD-oprJ operon [Paracoccaceae bacterium]|jgi:TetR/AcrR family transcriptional repressor of mexCD-oprJ operon
MSNSDSHTAILEAAFHVFGANPGASILDVAKEAGVGRATLYRHFATREALMVELAQIAKRELDAAVDAATNSARSNLDGLKLALAAIIPLADRQWFLTLDPVQQDPEIAELYQSSVDETLAAIKAARSEGAFATNLSDEWIAEVYDGLIYAAWTMVRRGQATHAEACAMAWATFEKGTKGK